MAFFESFTFKVSGLPLGSAADFSSAVTGTLFQKNTGDLYKSTADGLMLKETRELTSRTELDILLNKQKSIAVAYAIALG